MDVRCAVTDDDTLLEEEETIWLEEVQTDRLLSSTFFEISSD
jgi:hypothetical protein